MIDPQQCITLILSIDPESAVPLYDLIIWIRQASGALDQATLDQIEARVYSQTPDFERHLSDYRENRITIPKPRRKTEIAELAV